MKKIILLIALVVAPVVSYGQAIFDKLEDMDGVDAVIVNKDAFEILSKFSNIKSEGNEVMEVFNMIKDLNELKVFSTKVSSIATQMESMVKTSIKNRKLTELMRLKEGTSRVTIYVKTGGNKDFVDEVLMFIKGIEKKTDGMSEAVIVSLTGRIDINKLSKLADTFATQGKIEVKTN
tara:strand:+ start:32709 stop:33239 length:531 start_codon:yes stop_codon:yes gene_type:complete